MSEQLIRRQGVIAAIIGIALVLAQYSLEAARMAGDFSGLTDPQLQNLVWSSGSGVAVVLRVAGLTMIVVGLGWPKHQPQWFSPAGFGTAAVLVAFTFVGHTATAAAALGAVLLLHLAVVAFWFGSLWPLVYVSRRERAEISSAIVEQFSNIAIWLVPLLAVAGTVLAVAIVKSIEGSRTTYGRMLFTKIAAFCGVLLLATANKWIHAPRLAQGQSRFVDSFCRVVTAEYAGIAGILCLTAVLTEFYSPDM